MTADYLAAVEARARRIVANIGPVATEAEGTVCAEDVPRLVAMVREAEADRDRWEQATSDACNEVEAYRNGLAEQAVTRERDAARAALAGLVADLRALRRCRPRDGLAYFLADEVRALADRYDGEGEYVPCGCDLHGDHAGCDATCDRRGCGRAS